MKFVVLLVILVVLAAGAVNASPYMSVSTHGIFGSYESSFYIQTDPPGYPDGYQNYTFYGGTEQFKSYIAGVAEGVRYSQLSRPVMDPGQSWVIDGRIWSGTTDIQSQIGMGWEISNDAINYNYRLQVYSPAGMLIKDIVPNFNKYGYISTYATENFNLPVLPCSDWNDGYRFSLTLTNPVPEPTSLLALCGGFGGLFLFKRRG